MGSSSEKLRQNLDPAWQRRQALLGVLSQFSPLLLVLVFIFPLWRAVQLPPAPVQKSGDALIDALLRQAMLRSHGSKPAEVGEWLTLTDKVLSGLRPRFGQDPRFIELELQHDFMSSVVPLVPDANGTARTTDLAIPKLQQLHKSSKLSTPLLLQLILRRETEDRMKQLALLSDEQSQQLGQAGGSTARDDWAWLNMPQAQQAADLELIRELERREPDNALPFYLEAQQLCRYGDTPGAWAALAAASARPLADALPLCPAAEFGQLVSDGKEPTDKLAGNLLATYDHNPTGGGLYFDLYERLYAAALKAGNREQLEDLWLYLCRLGRARGVSSGLSRGCVHSLEGMIDDLDDQGLPGGVSGSAYGRLNQSIGTAMGFWNNVNYQGYNPWAAPTPVPSADLLDAWLNIVLVSDTNEQILEVSYQQSVGYRRAVSPGGPIYKSLQELEDFDYATMRWKTR